MQSILVSHLDAALAAYQEWAPDLKPRTVQRMSHDLNRFRSVCGNRAPEQVCTADFVAFRKAGVARGWAPATIEGVVSTVLTLLRFMHEIGELQSVPSKGRRLRSTPPEPWVPSLEEFGRMFEQTPVTRWPRLCRSRIQWWEAFLATAYFTALRLDDILRMQWDWIHGDVLVVTAEKTQKRHRIPIHETLARHLAWMPRVQPRVFFAAKKSLHQLRREMHRMAGAAGVKPILPQDMRVLSANQWELARPGCGLLIQGSGFRGSAKYYLDAQAPLREAVERLAVPECMRPEDDSRQLTLF